MFQPLVSITLNFRLKRYDLKLSGISHTHTMTLFCSFGVLVAKISFLRETNYSENRLILCTSSDEGRPRVRNVNHILSIDKSFENGYNFKSALVAWNFVAGKLKIRMINHECRARHSFAGDVFEFRAKVIGAHTSCVLCGERECVPQNVHQL